MKNLKDKFIDYLLGKRIYRQYLEPLERCEKFISELEDEYEKAFGKVLFNDSMDEISLAKEVRSNLKIKVGTSFEIYNQKKGSGVPHAILKSHLLPFLHEGIKKVDRNQLYEDFQKAFPLESLETMSLEKYTNLKKEDSFCYWVESRTYNLGSFWGGSSYKFGIYKYNKRPNDVRIQSDSKYAWYKKYNKDSAEEAFALVREAIVKVAHYARNGEFDQIEKVGLLGDAYKWKITFLYSDKQLVPVYKREMLDKLAKHFGMEHPEEKRVYELQAFLFHQKGEKDLFDFYEELIPIIDCKDGEPFDTILNAVSEKEASDVCQYWWLVCNPKIWTMRELEVGKTIEYSLYSDSGAKRRVFQNFQDARKGDRVIAYESTPTKQIIALAEVECESDEKSIVFKKMETLVHPVDYSILKGIPELTDMQFMQNAQGSLFKLTTEEYDALMEIIRGDNPLIRNNEVYTKKNFLDEVFIGEADYEHLTNLLEVKKNVILQGAPGVGKTFSAKRLAYAMMGEKDDTRIEMAQFHQNYSYEDFIMGYKPKRAVCGWIGIFIANMTNCR